MLDLVRALKKLKPDVLHTHSSKAGILGRLAGRWAGVPLVVHTFHGFGFNDRQKPWTKWFYIWLERRAAQWCQQLVFVSKANMQTARELKIGRPAQYELIRSGIPIEAIRERASNIQPEQMKKEFIIPVEDRVVMTISAFKPQKNLSDFVSVAETIVRQNPNVSFLMIGDGEMRPELEDQIKRKNLSKKIHLPGWRRDATEILAASDVFVLTSLWEGLPRSLLEALTLGKPAVCYDTDGVRDVLTEETGIIVPQRKTKKMVDSILKLLRDPSWALSLSRRARETITMEFDIDQMVKTQELLYLKALALASNQP